MLELKLAELARAIRNGVTQRKEANALVVRKVVRIRRRDLSLQHGSGEYEDSPSRIEEDAWASDDWQDFQHRVVEQMPEYKSLLLLASDKSHVVRAFSHEISSASFRGLNDETLTRYVNAYGRELEGLPLPVKVTAFISGLSIDDSPVVVSDGLIFRAPVPEDMTQDTLLDEYGGLAFPKNYTWFTVICEVNLDVISTGMAQQEFLRIVDALCLFRLGGVSAGRYRMMSSHSFLQGGTAELNMPNRSSNLSYKVSSADGPTLKAFLDNLVPLFDDSIKHGNVAGEKKIAYTRYVDALFLTGSPERAITAGIMALEALFLSEEQELSHRLAQRVAIFLRCLGTQPEAQTTYRNVKHGYKIRSIFVHGGSPATKNHQGAGSLLPTLLEYTRQCVLVFFQLQHSKKELITQLDSAAIDPAVAEQLRAWLASVLHK